MSEPAPTEAAVPARLTPAAMRAYIVERLVGETGAPEDVADAAASFGRALAPLFATALSAQLPAAVEVAFERAVLLRLPDARPTESGAVMVPLGFGGEGDGGVAVLDPAAVGLAVGVLFGADPALPPVPLAREPSPIERDVAGMVLGAFAAALAEADGPKPVLPLAEPLSGQAVERETLRDGPAVALRFRMGGAEGGTLALTVPQRLLLRRADAGGSSGADWAGRIGGELMRSAVTLEATMPLGRLTLGTLAALQPGAVLAIESQAPGSARLAARGRTLFAGEFGQIGGRYTLLLGEPVDAAQDVMAALVATR